jgi:hypothetical protein
MTVFISFSGSLSKAVAKLLDSWLPDVIQGVATWLSSGDIEKGTIWPKELIDALSTTVGISCVTQENKNAPWLLFEAGMLCKGVTKARVCPLLIDLQPKDVKPPLSLFNLTVPTKEDMLELIKTVNAADHDKRLDESRLQRAFDRLWPEFQEGLEKIRAEEITRVEPPKRSAEDMIVEILEITRALQRETERHQIFSRRGVGKSGLLPSYGYSGVPFSTETDKSALQIYQEMLEANKNPQQESESG